MDPQLAPVWKKVRSHGVGQLHLIRAVGVHQKELLTLTSPHIPREDDLLTIW